LLVTFARSDLFGSSFLVVELSKDIEELVFATSAASNMFCGILF